MSGSISARSKTLPFLLSLGKGGDDHVLSRIVRFFEDKGYRVHGAGDVAPDSWPERASSATRRPPPRTEADIDMAFDVVRALGRFDVGQAAVVVKGHVLAVEAAEGTDAMLARCAELREAGRAGRGGRAGVLVKAPKPGQEERVDLPTIGPETVTKAAAAGLSGIAVARAGIDGRTRGHHRCRQPARAFSARRDWRRSAASSARSSARRRARSHRYRAGAACRCAARDPRSSPSTERSSRPCGRWRTAP